MHRLQLRVLPIIGNWDLGDYRLIEHRMHWMMDHMRYTREGITNLGRTLGLPIRILRDSLMAALSPHPLISRTSLGTASSAIYDTFRSLPNLRHVEHSLSMQKDREF